jgi:hypothetical protein
MSKPKKQDVQAANNEITAVLANDQVLNALEEASRDRDTLEKARSNPKAFLKRKGVEVPRNMKLELSNGNHNLSKLAGITLCLKGCIGGANWGVCGEVCVSFEV